MKNIMRFKFVKRIILLSCVFIFSIANFIFASTYDISQINQVKAITEYSIDTKIEKMDTVTFGSYPQSDASGNTKDPIEWIVLEKQGSRVLLLSKNVLDVFEQVGTNTNNNEYKKYLKDMYKIAFNSIDSNLIENDEFIMLSKEDVIKYFIYDRDRSVNDAVGVTSFYLKRDILPVQATAYYAEKNRILSSSVLYSDYWTLSDFGSSGYGHYGNSFAARDYVMNFPVSEKSLFYCRPAIWVNINSINNSNTKSILGDNVYIEGIDVWQNQDGTIQIGGTQ